MKFSKIILILIPGVFFILSSCMTAGPRDVQTYSFNGEKTATESNGDITISAKYYSTDSWDQILEDSKIVPMMSVSSDDYMKFITQENLEPYYFAAFPLMKDDRVYFFPEGASLTTFIVSITNNTGSVMKLGDLRAAFFDADGERYNSLSREQLFDFIEIKLQDEIYKQKNAFSADWTSTMNLLNIKTISKNNRKFKLLNDSNAEIYPEETYNCIAFFDGGIELDKKDNVIYSPSGKLGIYGVPVSFDEVGDVTNKEDFIFDVTETTVTVN